MKAFFCKTILEESGFYVLIVNRALFCVLERFSAQKTSCCPHFISRSRPYLRRFYVRKGIGVDAEILYSRFQIF